MFNEDWPFTNHTGIGLLGLYYRKDEAYSQTTPTWSDFQCSMKIDHTTLTKLFSKDWLHMDTGAGGDARLGYRCLTWQTLENMIQGFV
jgi:hypothetical protein